MYSLGLQCIQKVNIGRLVTKSAAYFGLKKVINA